ncbi:MAG: hypothetical protein ACAI44_11265, partial [Candidatus Sericytochromatia bacterium]
MNSKSDYSIASRTLALCLTLSIGFGLAACNQSASPPLTASRQNAVPSQNQSAQKVSQTSVRGKMVLPYRLSDAKVASLANPVSFFLGQPAFADQVNILLRRSDLDQLQAYVNGELVELKILSVTFSGDDTVIEYEISGVTQPEAGGVLLLEVRTPNGATVLGGALTVVVNKVNTYDLTVETTSLLDLIREKFEREDGLVDSHPSRKLGELTAAELDRLKLDPTLLNKNASIRSILRKDGTLKAHALNRFKI